MAYVTEDYEYLGSELTLFAEAVNWRAYWQRSMREFLGARVLEVGAGIGTIARDLAYAPVGHWVALEPDAEMFDRLQRDGQAGRLPPICKPRHGTVASLEPEESFDTVMYIDVLEHIENDFVEIERVVPHLAVGGYLVVLVPAHQALFSPFDKAIGHFRRYSMRRLLAVGSEDISLCRSRYLDSAGLLASLANRLLLRSEQPTLAQIHLWDRAIVRLSRRLDPLLGYKLGKSALAVWRKIG